MRILLPVALTFSAICLGCVGSATLFGITTSPGSLEFVWDAESGEVPVGSIDIEVSAQEERDSIFVDIQHSPELRLTTKSGGQIEAGVIELFTDNADQRNTRVSVHRIRVYARVCHDKSTVSIQHVGLPALGSPPLDDPTVIPVRRVDPDPDPDPDPQDPPDSIRSNIAQINGLDTYVLNGVPFVFMTGVDSNGDGLSEVHNLDTGVREHAFPTVAGRDGTVACTPDGTLFFTVLIDDGTGFVRFETFDAATDNAYISPDFIAAQWIMGATKLPFVPVLLDKKIFTAPGAEFERQFLVTRQAGKIDGIEIVGPWERIDQTAATRAQNRAVAADGRGKDILSAHRNDTDGSTVIGRMKVGPTDNPAYFIEPIVTIPAVVNQLLPFGDSLAAWETGQTTGFLYRRAGDGDLTTADGTVALPANIIDAASGTMSTGETDRAYFLLADKIVELSAPVVGPVTSREIALPPGRGAPTEFNVVDVDGKESAVILFDDGIEIFDLTSS